MDIDIDFPTEFKPLAVFPTAIRASMVQNGELRPHPCGIYFQTIPIDKANAELSLSAIPYKDAPTVGATKIDFLHLSILNDYQSKSEIRSVIENEEYNWDAFQDIEIVSQLFQLRNHIDVLRAIKPQSVQELADCVAIIRPSKIRLLDQYLQDRENTRPQLFRQENEDKSAFKKSHAISYALTILLQLHKILDKK